MFVSRVFQVAYAASKSAAPFMAHVHQNPCRICEGLAQQAAENVRGFEAPATPSEAMGERKSATSLLSSGAEQLDQERSEMWMKDSFEQPTREPCTIEEMRSHAMTQWLREFKLAEASDSQWIAKDARHGGSLSQLKDMWDAFMAHGDGVEVEEDVLNGAVDYLDSLCERDYGDGEFSTERAMQDPFSSSIRNTPVSKLTTRTHSTKEVTPNEFHRFLTEQTSLTPAQIQRQLEFQSALLDVRDVLERICKIPFFLCCGTALGAIREQHFIAHDADIDVGVFVEDLVQVPQESSLLGSSGTDGGHDGLDADSVLQMRIMDLLVQLAEDNRLTCFDVCGEATKGLELRLLHNATRVPVDVNLYYPMLDSDKKPSQASSDARADFVWCATHYEKSDERKHGMYRYRHAPFRHALRRVGFCERRPAPLTNATGSSWGFLVPPEEYFVEYFGANWRVPEKYNYAEGLAGKYKNIIPE